MKKSTRKTQKKVGNKNMKGTVKKQRKSTQNNTVKKGKSSTPALLWIIVVALIVAFLIPPVAKGLKVLWNWGFSEQVLKEDVEPNTNVDSEDINKISSDQCFKKAKTFNIVGDIATYICTMPQNNPKDPEQMPSGTKITFGSITFDSETRVWVLRNFIVPNSANYSFDHSGRERRILKAGFYTGAEVSPVNGLPFIVCYDTTSNGCIPPHNIEFFD